MALQKLRCRSLLPRNSVDVLQSLLSDLASGDETRAERAVPVLIEIGDDAIPALLELTRSPEADSRWWALRVLAQSPHSHTGWLVPFLDDSDPGVRQCAALGLMQKPDEAAIQSLVRALNDADAMVCNLAANALIKIGKPAVPPLIEAVTHESQSVRIHVLRALAEIRDPRAIPVMMHVLEEGSALLGHWAKEGLQRLGLDMIYLKPM